MTNIKKAKINCTQTRAIQESLQAMAPTEKPLNILLIEDDPTDSELIREILAENPKIAARLSCADRLSTGLQKLHETDVDVILLDLSLPDSQGMETFITARVHAPGTPLIVLTENDREDFTATALRGMDDAALDYVAKGHLDGEVLTRVMRYGMERQRMLSELEQARQSELHVAYHDALTGLPNRQLFYENLHHALAVAKRHERTAAVLFLDLDGFKDINTTLGHNVGDVLLQTASERLRASARESDIVARLGGDEFAAILPEVSHVEDAVRVAQKFLSALSAPFAINGHELFITTSIGISLYPLDGADIDAIVKCADIAMYRAKHEGKNNYQFYNLSTEANALQRLSLESKLRKALDKNELLLHYQPQVDSFTGEITGVEALLRWHDPQAGMISPTKFIPIAEETGLIIPIGEWILRTACAQNRAWQDQGLPPIRVAVNLSPRQFRDKKLIEHIAKALHDTGLPPQWLAVEITEGSAMQNIDHTFEILQELKNMGVQLAIDDFGTGYSSLSYLKRFPIDKLKIDRSFIQGIPGDHGDSAIVKALIALSHNLNMKVVAEGVETGEQLEFLRALGCNELQGYLFSKPVAARELTGMLKNYGAAEIQKKLFS
jgi:diguanylate cyclase (GGDEF)-like protein